MYFNDAILDDPEPVRNFSDWLQNRRMKDWLIIPSVILDFKRTNPP